MGYVKAALELGKVGLGFVLSNLWRTGCIAALAMLAVQTYRVESLKADVAAEKLKTTAERNAHQQTKANYALAQSEATIIAERFRHDVEEMYRQKAREADKDASKKLKRALRSLVDYTDEHGMPYSGAGTLDGAPGATGTAPGGEYPVLPEGMSGASDMVAVSGADLRRCTEWVVYGVAAHDWAVGLETKGPG